MRRIWKKIRHRLEWLGLKAAAIFVPLLSRKACYRLALLLGSLGALLVSEDFERRLDEGMRKLPPMTSKVKLPGVAWV